MGAASITGSYLEKKGMGPYISGVHFLPAPYCYRCEFGMNYPDCGLSCANYFEKSIKYETSNAISCIVLEPIMMDVVIVPPEGYLRIINEICQDRDILLVADEVQSGLGRSGKWFAIEHWDIEPDIMILGKALGGGLPLGAYIASNEVSKAFEDMDFSSSCGGNPLACAAGLQMISIISNGILEKVEKMGEYFFKRLDELKEKHKLIGDIRGKGLFIGLELVKNKKTKIPAVKEAEEVKNRLKEKGLLTLTKESTFRLLPSLMINNEEIDKAIELFDEVLSKI
jgi:4-aminobutyrate aminotransferase-like enzyme